MDKEIINMIIDSTDDIFWVEKRKNFVKICFAFTPETDEDLEQVEFIYSKIIPKIKLSNYKIFSVSEENGKRTVSKKNALQFDEFMQILIPESQEITESGIEQLLAENKCNFNSIHKSFYSSQIVDMEKNLLKSIVITQTFITKSIEFSSCPIKIDPYNLAVYSVDVYGEGVENIDWKLN